jgi:hypothetical protein
MIGRHGGLHLGSSEPPPRGGSSLKDERLAEGRPYFAPRSATHGGAADYRERPNSPSRCASSAASARDETLSLR